MNKRWEMNKRCKNEQTLKNEQTEPFSFSIFSAKLISINNIFQ